VRDNPPWFLALVFCEVFIQLPFFFVAAYAYIMGARWFGRCLLACLLAAAGAIVLYLLRVTQQHT
jgi:hypothetical protein